MLTYAFPLLSLILFPFVRDADRSCVPSPSPLLPDALIHTSPYHSLSFPPLVPSTDHLSFLSLAHFQSRLYPQSDLYYYEVFSLISPPQLDLLALSCMGACVAIKYFLVFSE